MDYKNLIEQLRNAFQKDGYELERSVCESAADAIETMLTERDAAVGELLAFRTCNTCKNSALNRADANPCPFRLDCNGQYWEWRGPQKGENNDQTKL